MLQTENRMPLGDPFAILILHKKCKQEPGQNLTDPGTKKLHAIIGVMPRTANYGPHSLVQQIHIMRHKPPSNDIKSNSVADNFSLAVSQRLFAKQYMCS